MTGHYYNFFFKETKLWRLVSFLFLHRGKTFIKRRKKKYNTERCEKKIVQIPK